MSFKNLDAVATAEIVRSGELSADFFIEAALERISRYNPALNAVIDRYDEHARVQAKEGPSRGLLAGVPFLLKDTIDYPGFRYTDGSRYFGNRTGKEMHPWVAAMRAQGAVFIGKTNAPEFGLMDVTEPALHGPTRNPWSATLTPGGSSGGSAAAVAAGITPIAHGSDGGGSIRYPAACCGIFGFKPGIDPTIAPYRAFDARLPGGAVRHALTRSVRDSALVYAISMAALEGDPGSESRRWVREPIARRLNIAVIDQPTDGGPLSPAHRDALNDAIALLQSLGHTVRPARWPFDGPRQHRAFFARWAYGAYRFTQAMPPEQRSRFLADIEPFTRGLIEQGGQLTAEAVEALIRDGAILKVAMDGFHREHEVLLTPVSAVHPLLIGDHDPRQDFERVFERVQRNVNFSYVQNAAGQPGMSVPLYWTADNIPVGVHLAAGEGGEELLFRLAYELEYARPWQHRWPAEPTTAEGALT